MVFSSTPKVVGLGGVFVEPDSTDLASDTRNQLVADAPFVTHVGIAQFGQLVPVEALAVLMRNTMCPGDDTTGGDNWTHRGSQAILSPEQWHVLVLLCAAASQADTKEKE